MPCLSLPPPRPCVLRLPRPARRLPSPRMPLAGKGVEEQVAFRDLVLRSVVLVSSFPRGEGHQKLLEMVSTLWVLTGNETAPRSRLGTAIPRQQDEVWGQRSQGGDQEVSPNSLASSQPGPGWRGSSAGGAAGQLARGPGPWEAGQGAETKQDQDRLLLSLPLKRASPDGGVTRRGEAEVEEWCVHPVAFLSPGPS